MCLLNRINIDEIERLRSPERLKILEIERVVELCLEKIFVTRVLDIGTGIGLFAEAFALRNLEVIGIDKHPLMIKAASDIVSDASFKEASAENLPFADRSFDLAFVGHFLHRCDDPVLVLREACRVASKRIVVLEWRYHMDAVGPPLQERLKPTDVKKMATMARVASVKKIDLEHMTLYLMKPK